MLSAMREPGGLQILRLTRRFGSTVAVDGIDLAVPPAQMVGVIGCSGAGKSTLLRMINGLVIPTSGSIVYAGVEVTALTGKALRDWRACPLDLRRVTKLQMSHNPGCYFSIGRHQALAEAHRRDSTDPGAQRRYITGL